MRAAMPAGPDLSRPAHPAPEGASITPAGQQPDQEPSLAVRNNGGVPPSAEPVARACVALLSDWFPATTAEIVHVDGGFHAMGV